jgi:hypothetical protein
MRAATRFALVVTIFFGTGTASSAQSVMKQCGEQWQAATQSGATNGETWPQFLKECRAPRFDDGRSGSNSGRLRSRSSRRSAFSAGNRLRQDDEPMRS